MKIADRVLKKSVLFSLVWVTGIVVMSSHRADAALDDRATVRARTLLNNAVHHGDVIGIQELEESGVFANSAVMQGLSVPCNEAAMGVALVTKLIQLGMNASMQTSDDVSLLLCACENGKVETAKLLIGHGADVNLKQRSNFHRQSPLYAAVSSNIYDIVRLLLDHGADPNDHYPEDHDVLTFSINSKSTEKQIIQLLVERGALVNPPNVAEGTPLTWAAVRGDNDIVKLLLRHRAEINPQNPAIQTPLAGALSRGHIELVTLLLAAGADPNLGEGEDNCPLSKASERTDFNIVQLLLAHGASANPTNKSCVPPLLVAVKSGDTKSVAYLLDAGADVTARDNEGRTSLHLGAWNPDVLRVLLSKNLDVNVRDNVGQTPLHFGSGRRDSLRLLLARKANVNVKDNNGETPIFSLLSSCSYDECLEELKTLVQHGASVVVRSKDATTPLAVAISRNCKKSADYLLLSGASMDNDPAAQKAAAKIRQEKAIQRRIMLAEVPKVALCLAIPLAYLTTAIFLRESHFTERPNDNPMGTINSLFTVGISSALGGALLGTGLGFIAVPRDLRGVVTMMLGAITLGTAGLIGGLVGGYYARDSFNKYPGLYYSAPVLSIPLGIAAYMAFF